MLIWSEMESCYAVARRITLLMVVMAAPFIEAQTPGAGASAPPLSPKAAARIDVTGYWVSLITEDWRYRQFTPPKGDYESVPMNAKGRKLADAWDASKDEAAREQCKAYGAAGIMRMPTRLHITWQDDNTLRLDTDAGTQTRTFRFGSPGGSGGDWQGSSLASWEYPKSAVYTGFGGFDFIPGPPVASGGSLSVVTSKMRPGYLRKNGVPYGAGTVMTEYFDRFDVPGGESFLLVTSEVNDPEYLAQPFWTSTHFKKEKDASGWNPTPCTAQ